jgi:MFS family permease
MIETWGIVNSFGVFQSYYETDVLASSSSSSISWIGSLQASLLMLVGVISGPLYDAGYFRHLVFAGLILIVFGMFMTSLCAAYWQVLLAQGICVGVGMGLAFVPSTAVLAQWFHRRRALALGCASAGSPIGGIVFPIVFIRLQPTLGFAWATRVISFILLAISVIPIVLMRTRVPPTHKARALIDRSALHDAPFVLVVVASFFTFMTLYVAYFYLQVFDESKKISSQGFAPYTVTLLNAGSTVGRVAPNYIADKAGALNVHIACAIATTALLFGWMGIRSMGSLVVFALLYGCFSGGIVAVTPAVVMTMSPDVGRVGVRIGMLFMLTGIAVLIGTPIAGIILGPSSEVDWPGVMWYSAGALLMGTLVYLAARATLYRQKGGWKA